MDLAFPEEDWEMDKQQVYDSIIYSLSRDVTSAKVQNLAFYFIRQCFNYLCRGKEILNRFTATRAIVYPARNPDEITASFDWVIYDKAASIMKMMEEALGKENYDQAINKLLIRVLAKIKMHEKEKK